MLRFLVDNPLHRADDMQVRIHHLHSEGYPPSADGLEIKEQLPLRELLRRLMNTERNVENEIYRVAKALAAQDHRQIEMICEKYNEMYISLLRSGKAVLAQHTMYGIGGIGGIDPYNNQREQMAQRSALDYHREHMLREAAYYPSPTYGNNMFNSGPSEAEILKQKKVKEEKKRSDDLFYLTT